MHFQNEHGTKADRDYRPLPRNCYCTMLWPCPRGDPSRVTMPNTMFHTRVYLSLSWWGRGTYGLARGSCSQRSERARLDAAVERQRQALRACVCATISAAGCSRWCSCMQGDCADVRQALANVLELAEATPRPRILSRPFEGFYGRRKLSAASELTSSADGSASVDQGGGQAAIGSQLFMGLGVGSLAYAWPA